MGINYERSNRVAVMFLAYFVYRVAKTKSSLVGDRGHDHPDRNRPCIPNHVGELMGEPHLILSSHPSSIHLFIPPNKQSSRENEREGAVRLPSTDLQC